MAPTDRERIAELEQENLRLHEALSQSLRAHDELKVRFEAYVLRSQDLEQRTATLTYHAHKLERDAETLELNVAGYRGERELLLRRVQELERENAELKAALGGRPSAPERL